MRTVVLAVVDGSPEQKVAILYASLLAKSRRQEVALLYCIEPGDFQHWGGVETLVREQNRAEAEKYLQQWIMMVEGVLGSRPYPYIRVGKAQEELLKTLKEDADIAHLVLAAAPGRNPGPLLTAIAQGLLAESPVPTTIVPGDMEEAALRGFFTS
jgi:nucleotide-binding universal stress UspA family protein